MNQSLEVSVLYTGPERTPAALATADEWARRFDASVRLVVLQPVPYPLPLDEPPVAPATIAGEACRAALSAPQSTGIELVLCRDRCVALLERLPPHSLLVLGPRPRWWWCWERRLARALQDAGHAVVFTVPPTTKGADRIKPGNAVSHAEPAC